MQERKLFDCFVFNDELDLLQLRLEASFPFVDTFVLVEATKTFSGAEKPLHYESNRDRFKEWEGKIRHVVVNDMPTATARRWDAEIHQRNAILRGIEDAANDDLIIISDADEIVRPEVLRTLPDTCHCLTGLEMASTFHHANWEVPIGEFAWAARAIPYDQLVDPHHQRNHTRPEATISDAGRHFTSLGGTGALIGKFEAYSHAEMDNRQQKAAVYLDRARKLGLDVFSRELVSVRPPSGLCPLQRGLLELRPDLFDFADLPPSRTRRRFQRYAQWRSRQDVHSDLVQDLDRRYDFRPWVVRWLVLMEAARSAFYVTPKRVGGRFRGRIRSARATALSSKQVTE
jgi:hypothetical protein